jgi:threonine synthase
MKACAEGRVKPHSTVVCILTGNGLKDPDNAVLVGTKEVARVSLPADESAICEYLGV